MFTRTYSDLTAGAFVALAALVGIAKADSLSSLQLHYDPGSFSDGANGGGEFEAYHLSTLFNFAGPQPTPPNLATSGYGAGQAWDPAVQTTFQTFCVEDTVFFTPDTMYFSNPTATTHAGRALTPQVAYLFDQFWNHTLGTSLLSLPTAVDNYNYTLGGGRVSAATDLQQVIWFLIGEPAWASLAPDARQAAWISEANTATAIGGSWGPSIGSVRILQLSTNPGLAPAQDQLVEVFPPAAVNPTPLPSTAYAGLGLFGGLALLQTRRRWTA
jgi:hypothetical protein